MLELRRSRRLCNFGFLTQVHDTHYMCYTRYTAHPENYEGMNLLRDRRFGTPVVALQVGLATLAPGAL